MIAIIGAMEEEIIYLKEKINITTKKTIFNYTFYEGIVGKNRVVFVKSGVGKTNSGILAAILVSNYKIDYAINIGVCGGVYGLVNRYDLIVNTNCFYCDVDIRVAGNYQYGQMSNCPRNFPASEKILSVIYKEFDINKYKTGNIITSDKFITESKSLSTLINNYYEDDYITCVDMESASFAHSFYQFNIPFISIRSVSDIIGNNNIIEYENSLQNAANNCAEFVYSLIEKM